MKKKHEKSSSPRHTNTTKKRLKVSFWTSLAPRNRRKDITIWAWSCPKDGRTGIRYTYITLACWLIAFDHLRQQAFHPWQYVRILSEIRKYDVWWCVWSKDVKFGEKKWQRKTQVGYSSAHSQGWWFLVSPCSRPKKISVATCLGWNFSCPSQTTNKKNKDTVWHH